ncbi:hypothetical protein D5R81_10040 [Parashewanella spongiae]|uniref:PH domain-containing protein n=1 Tax=Parashewanella spongiae TaxID=342950 RepID=A0A3A6TTD5_9GAMM|nr:hypothetical protein [Parashewanella spongiae]MCL1079735.1 PH domain-containing protein [Parashewanella spongiae]RJY15125.1 hypothetical protein D5R81_10040 [Parashewanella spongiae]
MKVFKSKIDAWLLIIFLLIMTISLVAAVMMIVEKPISQTYLLSALSVVIGVFLPLWLLCGTRYIVDDPAHTLMIKNGPFKWKVVIDSITSVPIRKLWFHLKKNMNF